MQPHSNSWKAVVLRIQQDDREHVLMRFYFGLEALAGPRIQDGDLKLVSPVRNATYSQIVVRCFRDRARERQGNGAMSQQAKTAARAQGRLKHPLRLSKNPDSLFYRQSDDTS